MSRFRSLPSGIVFALRPPIYTAAFTPPALKRVTKDADGWFPVLIPISALAQMFGGSQRIFLLRIQGCCQPPEVSALEDVTDHHPCRGDSHLRPLIFRL
jgi:hypothetical protein